MRPWLLAGLLVLAAASAAAADLRVEDARAAPPLPGTAMMAGYLTVTNTGAAPATVQGAGSAAFDRISLHRSMERDGQSRMESVESLTLAPGERVAFEPGGLHLMMFGPRGEPAVGDTLPVELRTDAGAVHFDLQVIERAELLAP